MKSLALRKLIDFLMRAACFLSTALLGTLLLIILVYVAKEGLHALGLNFFLQVASPDPSIPGGGMGNAILGSLIMIGMSSLVGIPAGVLCGVYLSEYGRSRVAKTSRFLVEVLNGIPTIVFALVVYSLIVLPMKTFSAYAGAAALALIEVPLVARATELAVRQVPRSWREASVALGAHTARTTLSVVLPGARAGILTGATLALARVAGETAPLLFTALGNDRTWPTHLNRPTAALPLSVFNYAMTPYPEWKAQAWTGALVLVGGVLVLNVIVRVVARTNVNPATRM